MWRTGVQIFLLMFAQGLISTLEVARIAQGRVWQAAALDGVNALFCVLVSIYLIVDRKRLRLIPWYVAGSALSTALGTWLGGL